LVAFEPALWSSEPRSHLTILSRHRIRGPTTPSSRRCKRCVLRCAFSPLGDWRKAMEIEIGEFTLPSKRAAAEHFQVMLYRYDIGVDIPEPDATALRWLLTHHPGREAKIGCGVAAFVVRHAVYGTRCFEVIRADGSSTDFSYLTCIKGMAPSALTQALQAMRAAVIDDIAEAKRALFRESGGIVECAVTGEPISLEEARADHAPPRTFGTLAIAFLEARGIDPAAFITDSEDNQYESRIVDPELGHLQQ
jgi:hypothetical protein